MANVPFHRNLSVAHDLLVRPVSLQFPPRLTEAAVRVDAAQYRLFPEEELVEEVSADLPPYPFWTLLLNINDSEVAAEWSLSARIIGGKVIF